jgi:hypothetical protein
VDEVKLCEELARGDSLRVVAERHGIGRGTDG